MRKTISKIRLCYHVSLTVLSVAILSGCTVVFKSPLPRSLKTTQDDRLLGRWMGQDEDGNRVFVQSDRGPNGEAKISLFGEKSNLSELGYPNPIFSMATTKIGNNEYLILKYTNASKGRGYQLARYAVKDDKLTIWLLNVNKVKEAIKNGELKGKVESGFLADVGITDTWKRITTFLEAPNHQNLFVRLPDLQKVPGKAGETVY